MQLQVGPRPGILPGMASTSDFPPPPQSLPATAPAGREGSLVGGEAAPPSSAVDGLHLRADKLRRLAGAGVVGILVADFQGRVLDANDEFLDLLGYTREDLGAGLRWDLITPPEWRGVDELIMRALEATGEAKPVEKEYVHKNGHRVPVLVGGALLSRETTETVAFVVNLTRQREAEAAGAAAEARLAAIVTGSEDAIISKTLDGVVTSWNAAAERLFGYTAAEMIGQPILRVIPPERYGEEADILARVARGERVPPFASVRVRKDGTRFPVSLTVSPVRDRRDGAGTVVGAAKILRDVTAQQAAEAAVAEAGRQLAEHAAELEVANALLHEQAAELEATTEELQATAAQLEEQVEAAQAAQRVAEAASAAQGRFLATMSHEIRTPINAALGYAELLALGVAGPVTDQQRDFLARLQASSRHLLGLVNEVLDLAKSDAGELTVAREPARTGPAVAAALAMAVPLADAKGIRLVDARADGGAGEAGVAFEGVPYVGDEARVRQILVNLLTNAVKFTPPGGRVTVTCDTVAVGGPASEGPWAAVRVEDTGVGIAPDEQARVFAPFHQVDGGHTRAQGGTGLGLTISRQLARLMGGDLGVESRPGAGSTFTLWLPAGPARPDVVDGAGPESAGARRDLPRPAGLAAVGTFLRERLERVLEDYVERVRHDPTLPPDVRTMLAAEIEDHGITFFGDLVQSLVAIEQTGGAGSPIVRDGTAIQRFVAELHGRQRERLGWTEAQLARDYAHKAAALEGMTRRRSTADADETETAVRVLRQLVDRAAASARHAFRHARHASPGTRAR